MTSRNPVSTVRGASVVLGPSKRAITSGAPVIAALPAHTAEPDESPEDVLRAADGRVMVQL